MEKLDSHIQKNINSKDLKDLNLRHDTIKFPRGGHRQNIPLGSLKSVSLGNRNKNKKMLITANYYRNVDQNYNEVPPHSGQNGHH